MQPTSLAGMTPPELKMLAAQYPTAELHPLMSLGNDILQCIIDAVVQRDQLLNAWYAWLFSSQEVYGTLLELRPQLEPGFRDCNGDGPADELEATKHTLIRWVQMANDMLLATFNGGDRSTPSEPCGRNWLARQSRQAVGLPYTNLQVLAQASVLVLEGCESPLPRPPAPTLAAPHHYYVEGLPEEFYKTLGTVCSDMPRLRSLRVCDNDEDTGGLAPFFRGLWRRTQLQPGLVCILREVYWSGDGKANHRPSINADDAPSPTTNQERSAWEWVQDLSNILRSQRLPYLQVLHLTFCGLTDIELDMLSPALWRQRNLLSLGFRNNERLTAQGLVRWLCGPEILEPAGAQASTLR